MFAQVGGDIVTIELPESLIKDYWEVPDFKTRVEDFRAKHPTAKECGAKQTGKTAGTTEALTTPKKKRPLAVDLTSKILPSEDAPSTTAILEVPIMNGRAPAGKTMESMPVLTVGENLAYIKNETGLAVPCLC